LREIQRQPADLVSPEAADLLRACQPVIDESRLQRLLGRGFLLSQVIEHWQTRAIWVLSRADAEYPRRLKARLREDSPSVLYGCGDIGLLESGGLAVVGSRRVNDALIDYTMDIGRLAARAGRTIISGGAKGIDQAALRGALEAGGKVCGVLADSLEKTVMNREHRNFLLDGQLTLISPYDPGAGFNVGHAMQRNKLIYALADASLVVNSDLDKGGTWEGAREQLDKLKFVPVYVRSTGGPSAGLEALRKKGALPWPNPACVDSFGALFNRENPVSSAQALQGDLLQFSEDDAPDTAPMTDVETKKPIDVIADTPAEPAAMRKSEAMTDSTGKILQVESSPAEAVFAVARAQILRILNRPMKEEEVAEKLDVEKKQAQAWLQRIVEEGVLEKREKPACYIVKQPALY
jgi:predicted Rossmann fold nucleotide-binding protein DprA/Smf involved in DNA uptake